MPEQGGIRAGAGKRDADAAGSFDDPGRDLDQPQADGGELGNPEVSCCTDTRVATY